MLSEVLYGAFAEVVWLVVGAVVAFLGWLYGMSTQRRVRGGSGGGLFVLVAVPAGAVASAIAASPLLMNDMSDRVMRMACFNALIFGISSFLGAYDPGC